MNFLVNLIFLVSQLKIFFLAWIVQLICCSVRCISSQFFIQFFGFYPRTCPAMFFNTPSPSMIFATILFFNFSDFYCFAVKICVREVIWSALEMNFLTGIFLIERMCLIKMTVRI